MAPQARWLQCKDPKVMSWYNMVLLHILQQQNILDRLQQLNRILQEPGDIRSRYWKELNAINQALTEAKKGMENQCHKLKCGQVQWYPRVTWSINKILFWKNILKWELGGKVGLSILQTRAHKAGFLEIPFQGEFEFQFLKQMISKVHKHFKC